MAFSISIIVINQQQSLPTANRQPITNDDDEHLNKFYSGIFYLPYEQDPAGEKKEDLYVAQCLMLMFLQHYDLEKDEVPTKKAHIIIVGKLETSSNSIKRSQ